MKNIYFFISPQITLRNNIADIITTSDDLDAISIIRKEKFIKENNIYDGDIDFYTLNFDIHKILCVTLYVKTI